MYFGNNKDRFQLQFPDAVCQRLGAMPKEFTLKSQRKGVKRFWTPFITEKFTLLQRVGICPGVLIVVGGAETGFVKTATADVFHSFYRVIIGRMIHL